MIHESTTKHEIAPSRAKYTFNDALDIWPPTLSGDIKLVQGPLNCFIMLPLQWKSLCEDVKQLPNDVRPTALYVRHLHLLRPFSIPLQIPNSARRRTDTSTQTYQSGQATVLATEEACYIF